MQSRTVARNVPHLAPILDSLRASAVVLEVGCGPGGITLDIAKRYPHLQVFGVDIDEASIKVRHGASIAFVRADGVVIVGTRRSDSSWYSKSEVHKR